MNLIMYAVSITAGLFGAIFIYTYHSTISHAWSARLFKNRKLKSIERYKHSKLAGVIPVASSGFPEIKRKNSPSL